MGILLKIILISVLVYYTIKTAFRLFLPFLGKKFEQELYKRANQQERVKKEGEVTLQYRPKDSIQKNKDLGEYVDFEEVDD